MKTPVDALVITCMDARLHRADLVSLGEFLRGKHVAIRARDQVSLPGGVRGLVAHDQGSMKDTLLQSVKVAHDLHRVTKVFLINHSDCGAYGGTGAFADATEEYRKHAEDLRAARAVVRETLPNLDVVLFFATIEDRADGPFVTFDEVR